MITAPCKGCTERHKACHDTCDKYKTWRDVEREKKFQLQQLTLNEADMMHIDNIYKAKKRRNYDK